MKVSNQRLLKIEKIAADVRGDLLWEYYYKTTKEWKGIYDFGWCAKVALEHDFCGWCARASARLFNALKAAGFKPRLIMSESEYGGHVFVVVRGYVVDITATQFSGELEDAKPVTILPRTKDTHKHWFYQTSKTFTSAEALRRYQKRVGWPDHQMVQGVDKKYAANV